MRIFERDQLLSNVSKDSGLTHGAVHIDEWNKMKVALMTQPFEDKTISALMVYINSQLPSDVLNSIIRRRENETTYKYHLRIFAELYKSAKLHKLIETSVEMQEDLGFLQFAIIFNGLFHSRFLCKDVGITKENFESEKAELTEIMFYFSSWRVEAVKNGTPDKKWYTTCISSKTYHNLRKLVSGFIAYAENVLKFDGESFIPYLHGNKSSIESLFSYARGLGKDNAQSYPTAITGNSYSFSTTRLTNNQMYTPAHIGEENNVNNECYGSTDDIHKEKEKLRNIKFEEWNGFLEHRPNESFRVFPNGILKKVKSLKNFCLLRLLFEQFSLKDSLLNCLLERELGLLAKLSINTKYETWFGSLYTLTPVQAARLNVYCHKMAGIILDQIILSGQGSLHSSQMTMRDWSQRHILKSGVYIKAWNYMISNKFPLDYTFTLNHPSMPDAFRQRSARMGYISIFVSLVEFVQEELHTFLVKQMVRPMELEIEPDNVTSQEYDTHWEVNRFVGSAIGTLILKTKRGSEKRKLLRKMGSKDCHLGDDYLQKYVSQRDRLMNKGGLSFVTEKFFNFGATTLKLMSTFVLQDMLENDGPDAILNFRNKVMNNQAIKDSFMQGVREFDYPFSEEVIEWVRNSVLLKCCNSYNKAQTSLYKTNIMLQNCADLNKLNFRDQFKANGGDALDKK